MPSNPAATTIHACVTSSNRRRSTMSANAPAGRLTQNTGAVVAACTRLTISGDMVSDVISQPAQAFYIQVPVEELTAANHRERNRGSRSGSRGEPLVRTDALLAGRWTGSGINLLEFRRQRATARRMATRDCAALESYRGSVR